MKPKSLSGIGWFVRVKSRESEAILVDWLSTLTRTMKRKKLLIREGLGYVQLVVCLTA